MKKCVLAVALVFSCNAMAASDDSDSKNELVGEVNVGLQRVVDFYSSNTSTSLDFLARRIPSCSSEIVLDDNLGKGLSLSQLIGVGSATFSNQMNYCHSKIGDNFYSKAWNNFSSEVAEAAKREGVDYLSSADSVKKWLADFSERNAAAERCLKENSRAISRGNRPLYSVVDWDRCEGLNRDAEIYLSDIQKSTKSDLIDLLEFNFLGFKSNIVPEDLYKNLESSPMIEHVNRGIKFTVGDFSLINLMSKSVKFDIDFTTIGSDKEVDGVSPRLLSSIQKIDSELMEGSGDSCERASKELEKVHRMNRGDGNSVHSIKVTDSFKFYCGDGSWGDADKPLVERFLTGLEVDSSISSVDKFIAAQNARDMSCLREKSEDFNGFGGFFFANIYAKGKCPSPMGVKVEREASSSLNSDYPVVSVDKWKVGRKSNRIFEFFDLMEVFEVKSDFKVSLARKDNYDFVNKLGWVQSCSGMRRHVEGLVNDAEEYGLSGLGVGSWLRFGSLVCGEEGFVESVFEDAIKKEIEKDRFKTLTDNFSVDFIYDNLFYRLEDKDRECLKKGIEDSIFAGKVRNVALVQVADSCKVSRDAFLRMDAHNDN